MSWIELTNRQDKTLICWFPGWSFSPQVFSPLYQQLPGAHLGAEFIAADSMEDYANTLAVELNKITATQNINNIVFIGWSLGGALAMYCLQQFQKLSDIPAALITLATGERFLQQAEISQQGMEQQTFVAFSTSLEKFPAKTAKRFLGLCTQHADNARELMRDLANSQITDESVLIRSLSWLNYAQLPQQEIHQQHWYSDQDGFNPRRLSPAFSSTESSHVFFLTKPGQTELLNSIRQLQKQLSVKEPVNERL